MWIGNRSVSSLVVKRWYRTTNRETRDARVALRRWIKEGRGGGEEETIEYLLSREKKRRKGLKEWVSRERPGDSLKRSDW